MRLGLCQKKTSEPLEWINQCLNALLLPPLRLHLAAQSELELTKNQFMPPPGPLNCFKANLGDTWRVARRQTAKQLLDHIKKHKREPPAMILCKFLQLVVWRVNISLWKKMSENTVQQNALIGEAALHTEIPPWSKVLSASRTTGTLKGKVASALSRLRSCCAEDDCNHFVGTTKHT